MLVIVAEKVEWSFADMLASRSSVRFANDPTGVIVPKQEMTEINKRLIRSELLPSYDILIMPKRPRGR